MESCPLLRSSMIPSSTLLLPSTGTQSTACATDTRPHSAWQRTQPPGRERERRRRRAGHTRRTRQKAPLLRARVEPIHGTGRAEYSMSQ